MGIVKVIKNKVKENIINPFDGMINEELSDITTTIGSFIIKNIRGRFQRTISFTIGNDYEDYWMEEALYKILNKYNNINRSSSLDLNTTSSYKGNGRKTYLKLADGAHSLKYREYKILLIVNNNSISSVNKIFNKTTYTILTYNLDPKFVTLFEKDMINARNEILAIPKDSPFVNIYKDIHEPDGYTYWQKLSPIPKRKFNSIYLNNDKKELLIKTLNNFISSKNDYIRLGIPWNLKILLYGEPGVGKDSICKAIASEYNRNIYYVIGGKGGKFVPNALLSDNKDIIKSPLFIISDIDKYPFLINESEIDLSKDSKDETTFYKQLFGQMINAMDGIMSGDGKIIIMTTNHIDKFSPTFLRPGRIDLIMKIDFVTPDIFRKYVFDNYNEVLPEDIKLKKDDLTISDMNFNLIFLKQNKDEFISSFIK